MTQLIRKTVGELLVTKKSLRTEKTKGSTCIFRFTFKVLYSELNEE